MPTDRRARILVVDDEAGIRGLLERALRERGHDVIAVSNGQVALEAVLTADTPYDLVITNNSMPGMEGQELVARLRAARPGLPIVHLDDMSGSPHVELPADVPNITKPFPMTSLVTRIEEMLPSRTQMGSQVTAFPDSEPLA
jgi:two-component system, cell cycle response regulator CpdR